MIDLRSDTVTRPTPAMREAIAAAAVGDDQFGEDPSINALQERVAELLGKQSALWLPTGTMANQVALRVLTRPGDDVIVSAESHAVWHETGGSAANAGVQFTPIGRAVKGAAGTRTAGTRTAGTRTAGTRTAGTFTADEFLAAVKLRGHMIYPPTTLVEIENTHNRAGGVVFPQGEAERICAAAKERGIATYLDGARLWNAAVASKREPAALAAPFDLVAVALSKGLGAPGGSLLAGARELVDGCLRHRRMLGGAMRQVGHFGAAGLHALEHHMGDLLRDHEHAQLIARRLAACPGVLLDPAAVHTNILVFGLADPAPDAPTVVARAQAAGVLVFAFGPRTVRAVTHRDVSREECERAAELLVLAVTGAAAAERAGRGP
jgi:threonine aldolase